MEFNNNFSRPLPRLTGVAAALVLGSQQVAAQGMALEEIVVTAQKRTESIQDTPISIAAFDAGALEAKGISNLTDLQTQVPNFQLTPTPTSSTSVRAFMRGVGNNDDQITQDPSVAIYMDGVYVGRNQGLVMDIADIERIEVLRGPQGSLYGRNATGGAINFISREPDFSGFGLKQTFSVGSRNYFRSNTRLNLPITDQLAGSLSYLTSEKDGFVKNLGTGKNRYGDEDREAWRADLLWRPVGQLEVRYNYDRSTIGDTPSFIAEVPLFPEQGKRPSHGSPWDTDLRSNDITSQGHGLSITWDLRDDLVLKSITSYRELDDRTNRKYLVDTMVPQRPLSESVNRTEQDQFSQEFQLSGEALDQRLDYVAGIYYFKESADRSDISWDARRHDERTVTADNKAYAVFGQGTYTPDVLEDRLHITLGARWSRDERRATRQLDEQRGAGLGPRARGSNNYSNVSPTLVAAYDLADDVNVYGKVSRGYKSGGYNIRASSPQRFEEGFDEESLTSYELGIKSQFWNQRLRVNAAVFQSEYKDIQLSVRHPTEVNISDIFNAGEARIRGTELELAARLLQGLTANLSYAYLDAEYRKVMDGGVDRASDYRFINAPRHSYAADLEYRFPALPFGQLAATVSYTWQDEKRDSVQGPYLIDDYGLLNARLSLSEIPMGNGDLRIAAWGRNLENKEYYLTHFQLGVPAAMFGEPRTYGLDITYEY